MKIAQVTAYWGPAYPTGSGVFCYELSKRLAKEFEVHVFTSEQGNFNDLNSDSNFYLHPLRTYATIWNMNPVANVFTKLLQGEFDIVHVHSLILEKRGLLIPICDTIKDARIRKRTVLTIRIESITLKIPCPFNNR